MVPSHLQQIAISHTNVSIVLSRYSICFAGSVHHDNAIIMGAMASQITSLTIVYSTVYSGADQRKHQRFASLAFVRGIHRYPMNSPHKGPVTRKMFPFDDVIMFITVDNATWAQNDINLSLPIALCDKGAIIILRIILNKQKTDIPIHLLYVMDLKIVDSDIPQ